MAADSTIAAIATGPAAGGIGVIRLSGPQALQAARAVTRGLPEQPRARHAHLAEALDAEGQPLDQGLALWFPAPHSYTGEDVVELQLHGAPAVLSLVLARALAQPGVRLAQPGEFTRRAFLNGRMELARAEAVADLIAADSAQAVRAAAAQLVEGLGGAVRALREAVVALHAQLEGALDFPDESEGIEAELGEALTRVLLQARALASSAARGALVRRGARVVLFGPVNAGKSTLFNALAGAERALVDEAPGTTRDALEVRLELDGLGVTLVDTAGLRAGAGRLEALGIARTHQALAAADLAVLVLPPQASAQERSDWLAAAAPTPVLEVQGKADTLPSPVAGLAVSGKTLAGLPQLTAALLERLGGAAQAVALSTARHHEALGRALEALERAAVAQALGTLEVVAGEVSAASQHLGELTGDDATVDVIDAIFRRFCIGK